MSVLGYFPPCAGYPCTDIADAWSVAWLVGAALFVALVRFLGAAETARERVEGLVTCALLALVAAGVAFQGVVHEDPRWIRGWGALAAGFLGTGGSLLCLAPLASAACASLGWCLEALGSGLHGSESGGAVYRRLAVPARR